MHASFGNLAPTFGVYTFMPRLSRVSHLVLLALTMISAAHSQSVNAENEFAAGTSAKNNGHYEIAMHHFQGAIALDPKMIEAHFALGTVTDVWCGLDGGDARCLIAIDEYKKVLELDSSREDATKNLALALYRMSHDDDAEAYYRKALALDRNDPDALCGVASFDMRKSFRVENLARFENDLKFEQPLIHSPACAAVREKNVARVEEGITLLTAARVSNEHSTELLGYLAELHRERAEIQCGNPRAYRADMNAATKMNRMRNDTWKRNGADSSVQKCPPAPPPPPPKHRWFFH